MYAAEIVDGAYYKDQYGLVFQVLDLITASPRRVRYKIVHASRKGAYTGPRQVGETGTWQLRNFASRMVSTTTRRCRHCRCTDARACVGGCSWIAWDVCSQCTPEQLKANAAFDAAEAAR
jgi:hypothetical protein